jgi:hypothetical protein
VKVALISANPSNVKHPIDAYIRTGHIISKALGWDYIFPGDDIAYGLRNKYDALIFVYSSFYADIKAIEKLFEHNPDAMLLWLANEYNLGVNTVLGSCPRGYSTISNYERQIMQKNVRNFYCVNLNVLIAKKPNPPITKKYDIVYYGTYRENREVYFKEYFKDRGICLSTSNKNYKKFAHIGCNPTLIPKLDWTPFRETLNLFHFSLYIEDPYTHKVYNHLANRFYEAGFCNVVTLFDSHCKNTWERAGLDVPDIYIVSGYEDMMEKVALIKKDFKSHLEFQSKWHTNSLQEKEDVLKRIKEIVEIELQSK